MANDLIVRILGDTKGLERSFAKANQATATFGRNVQTTGAKVDKTARSFSSFAKGAAAGFGGAVAFNVALDQVRAVVSAAAESEQVVGQTRVALESTGKSWADYGDTIEAAIAQQSRLGFDDEALLRTFSLFVRQSRDVGEALRRNSIAMNLARARFIDLEQAANLVNKAALGQAGALRRVGIDARTGASGVELLAQLEREFAGAAEDASTTAGASFERLKVSMENVQEALGSALLPTLTEFASALSDTADTATLLVGKLRELGSVRIPVIDIPLNFTVGGQKVTDIGKFVARRANPFSLFFNIQDIKKALEGDDTPAKAVNAAAKAFDDNFDSFTETLEKAAQKGAKKSETAAKRVAAFGEKGFKPLKESLGQLRARQAEAADEARAAEAQARAIAGERLLADLSLGIDRAALTTSLRDDLAALASMRAGLEGLIRSGQDVQNNQARLVDTIRQIADRRREIEAAAQEALQARQFRALGLSATGGERIPSVENLRKQLESLSDRVVGETIPRKLRDQLARVGGVLKGQFGKVTDETRGAIRDLFATIRGELNTGTNEVDRVIQRRPINLDKLFGQFTPTASFTAGTGGSVGGVNITGPITVVADNPDAFLRELQKKAGRTSASATGRFPGRSLGLS